MSNETNYTKKILTSRSKKLAERCSEIDPRKEGKELQEIVLSLKQTMKEKNIVSLTAPQIGFARRVACVKFGDNDYRTFVNPVIDEVGDFKFAREKCSSIPGKEYIRPRYNSIRVMYMTPLGKVESRAVKGRTAVVIEHCLDHLDGLLLSDIGLEIDELFDQATDAERDELLKMYAESLDIRQKEIQKEIEEDKDLKQINDAIKFMDKIKTGDIKIEKAETETKTEDK